MSTDGKIILAVNGEIYNHLALRTELGSWDWRGHSDTETILGCITRYGIQATLPRLRGMFAIALCLLAFVRIVRRPCGVVDVLPWLSLTLTL